MFISLTPENTKNYTENFTDSCKFCEDKNNLVNTFYDNEIIKCCPLCNMIVNFNESYIFHGFLCKTNLSQLDIIKKTKEIYKKTGNIPFLNEIDKDAKKINIPTHLYAQFKNRTDYKFHFTNKIGSMINEDVDDIFDIVKSKEKRNIMDYLNVEEHEFDEQEKKMIKEEYREIKKNNYASFKKREENFLKKIAGKQQ